MSENKIQLLAKEAFKAADADNSNTIDIQELTQLIHELSSQLSIDCPEEIEIKEIFSEFDKNDDGELQFDEFLEFIEDIFFSADINSDTRKSSRIKRSSGFMNSISNKKNSNFNDNISQLLKKASQKLSRVSCLLDETQKNIDSEYFACINQVPKDCKNPTQWIKDQQNKEQRSSMLYIQRKKADSMCSQGCTIYDNNNIKTVIATLQPSKNQSAENTPKSEKRNLNDSSNASPFSRSRQESQDIQIKDLEENDSSKIVKQQSRDIKSVESTPNSSQFKKKVTKGQTSIFQQKSLHKYCNNDNEDVDYENIIKGFGAIEKQKSLYKKK